jgi:curli biogenesis system outer membrane secretion channel CsgG
LSKTLWAAGLVCAAAALPAPAQQKLRVAVMNFEYATVQGNAAAIFGTNVDIGKGIADILVEKLVNAGRLSVMERKNIDKVLAEQNFSNSDRANSQSAAKIGRILGVDAIVMGSITQFGRDDRTTNVGGNVVGGLAGRYGLGGVGRREAKAVVGISARLVSADTGEILAAATGVGESRRGGATLLGSGGSGRTSAGGIIDMNSVNFANTVLGEATHAAVDQVAIKVHENSARIPAKVVEVHGLVAYASGDTVILNVGSKAGVKVGDKLEVRRGEGEVRDPATGRVIRRLDQKVGEAVVTKVDELSADATFTGSGPAKVGDRVSTLR